MFHRIEMTTLVTGVLIAAIGFAQAPAAAPVGPTGMCRDGSYWTGATKKGACRGHKGVQDWYAGAGSAGAAPTGPAPTGTAAAPAGAAVVPAAPASTSPKGNAAPTAAAAPGGGAGQVWVNKTSKVYHCPSDRWYGKTKNGAYMSKADAIAQGNHADHGKACN